MNIRKNIDYSAMFAALDAALNAELPQMKLCCELGRIVCSRPEKGAAVAAAEHLHSRFPDASGFSPRNLRRMREFYRMYEDTPELLALAMEISWTQNVVIFVPLVVLAGQRWNSREKSILTPIWKSNSTNLRFRAILSAIATSWSVRSMIRILFLCHGNICRSPMAEFIMKDLVKKAGLEQSIQIESAATSTEEIGNPVYPPARRKLSEHGIDCSGKRARQLLNSDYEKYDLLIGTAEYVPDLRRRFCRQDAPADGLYQPSRRGGRSVVHRRFRHDLAGCGGRLPGAVAPYPVAISNSWR